MSLDTLDRWLDRLPAPLQYAVAALVLTGIFGAVVAVAIASY